MNRKNDAEKDLAKLKQLNPRLASKLEYAIKNNGHEKDGKTPFCPPLSARNGNQVAISRALRKILLEYFRYPI